MTSKYFNLEVVDPSWRTCIKNALSKMDAAYLNSLYSSSDWLPGHNKIFNAFSLPFEKTNYVLLGESPYPRKDSANGYAFWDASVASLWSETGLDKKVNRATSLRNLIKMLLVANGALNPSNTSQTQIMQVDKSHLVQTNAQLFNNLIRHGFLLLNATPVLQKTSVSKDAKQWLPFVQYILTELFQKRPHVELILLGGIAKTIDKLVEQPSIKRLYAEHPYNVSFIQNQEILTFFKPLQLLSL